MKTILHSDLNNFYASCERVYNPKLAGTNFCVCGSIENRHGIVLAKNEGAKKLGVKTGMTISAAKDLCPDLVLVPADFEKYLDFSQKVRKIYLEYTDLVEPFGIDEAWLDVTNSTIFGDGEKIASEIRQKIRDLGLTASVGISFNKIFAKLGSDLRKPDAQTLISYQNFKQVVWPLKCSELLMVGGKTAKKLARYNINTIGELATIDSNFLVTNFGKWGAMLSLYANGQDNSPVKPYDEPDEIKSIGNSMTCYRDMVSLDDIHIMFSVLADSVSSRLIKKGIYGAKTLSVTIRDEKLQFFTRQAKLPVATCLSEDFVNLALKLFKDNFDFSLGVRTLGLSVSDFSYGQTQLSIFESPEEYDKKVKLAKTVGVIRDKYGNRSLQKAITLKDRRINREDPQSTHVISPPGPPTGKS